MRRIIGIGVIILIIVLLLKVIPTALRPHVSPTETPPITQVKADATEANIKISAISFFEEYDNCINDQSQTSSSCLQKNTTVSTELLKDKTGLDPLCGGVLPDSYTANRISIKGTTSTVEVVESVGNTTRTVLLVLAKEDDKWKVQKITCPTK